MQDDIHQEAAPERDPREELIENARDKFKSGDFDAVREWLDKTIDETAEETSVLKPIRENLKLDPGAVVVAAVSGLALLVVAALTLFH